MSFLLGQGPSALHCVLSEGSFWSWMGQREIGRVVIVLCHHCHGKTQLGIKSEFECWGHHLELKSEESQRPASEGYAYSGWGLGKHVVAHQLWMSPCICLCLYSGACMCSPMCRSVDNLRCYYSGHIPLGFVCLFVCLVSWLVGLFFEKRSV